jgi:hypothetical protein
LEFETCDRYDVTYESPEYDVFMGKYQGFRGLYPKRRKVCSLRRKEAEAKLLSSKYSDTCAKLQDLSSVLDDGITLTELDDMNTNLNRSLVKSEMRDKAGVDAATLAKNCGTGIEAAKRTRL